MVMMASATAHPPMTTSTKFDVDPGEMEEGLILYTLTDPTLDPSLSLFFHKEFTFVYIYKNSIEYSVDSISLSNFHQFFLYGITSLEPLFSVLVNDYSVVCFVNSISLHRMKLKFKVGCITYSKGEE